MLSLQSQSIFFIHTPKAGTALRVNNIHRDMFSRCRRQILYRNKIKSPE